MAFILFIIKTFQQIAYFGLCLPGFIAQFLPFMQRFKVQHVSDLFMPEVKI